MSKVTPPKAQPKSGRPYMPGYGMMFKKGRRSLSWTWAVERLSKAHNYLFATTHPNGRPHVMPVWGLWLDDRFYFSTGRQSRKARNLATNPSCTVCTEDADQAVIMEGTAREVKVSALPHTFNHAYEKKYDWKIEGNKGPFYVVEPRVVFGFVESGEANPIRWLFSKSRHPA